MIRVIQRVNKQRNKQAARQTGRQTSKQAGQTIRQMILSEDFLLESDLCLPRETSREKKIITYDTWNLVN